GRPARGARRGESPTPRGGRAAEEGGWRRPRGNATVKGTMLRPAAMSLALLLPPADDLADPPRVADPPALDAPTAAALLRSVERFAAADLDDLAAKACRRLVRAYPRSVESFAGRALVEAARTDVQ